MKNKTVLIHVKDNEALNNYIRMIENNKFDDVVKYSKEIRRMIEEFYSNNWKVYLTTIENFKNGIWKNVYYVNENKRLDFTINQINEKINFMIIRNLGSVEGNFDIISEYLNFLIDNYKGHALNNPTAMRKGMTKNYLVEIDRKELEKIGMLTIPTQIYDKKVTYNQITNEYNNLEEYLIKPSTGELSNSLKCLKDIDEEFLRYKESKVGGWIIQPIKKDIWNGEYQLVFVGGNLIYAQKKNYPFNGQNLPNQKNRIIEKYNPSEKEINIGKRVIEYFSNLYNIKLDICRIDFMKNENGMPILIEFEMVNPGFFIGYMDENDEAIKNITRKIRQYCESKF